MYFRKTFIESSFVFGLFLFSTFLNATESFFDFSDQIPKEIMSGNIDSSDELSESIARLKELEDEIKKKMNRLNRDTSFSQQFQVFREELPTELYFYSRYLVDIVDRTIDLPILYQTIKSQKIKNFFESNILNPRSNQYTEQEVFLNSIYGHPEYEKNVIEIFRKFKIQDLNKLIDYIRLRQIETYLQPNSASRNTIEKKISINKEIMSNQTEEFKKEFEEEIENFIKNFSFVSNKKNSSNRILVISHGSGGGLLSLGKAIHCFLSQVGKDKFEVKFLDLFKDVKGGVIQNLTSDQISHLDIYNEAYVNDNIYLNQSEKLLLNISLSQKKQTSLANFEEVVRDYSPDLIILTSSILYDYQRFILRSGIPLWVYQADFIPVVLLENEKNFLHEHGVAGETHNSPYKLFGPIELSRAFKQKSSESIKYPFVKTTIPLKMEFESEFDQSEIIEFKRKYSLDKNKKLASFSMGSWGNKVAVEFLQSIVKEKQFNMFFLRNWQFFFIAGENLYDEMQKLLPAKLSKNIKVVKHLETREMKQLLYATDFFVSKAGGITTEEVLKTNTYLGFVPTLLTYEHEKYNFEYLYKRKKSMLILNPKDLFKVLKNIPKLEKQGILSPKSVLGRTDWRDTILKELNNQFPSWL